MDQHQEDLHCGTGLGYEAAEHIAKIAEDYCASQRRFLELANEPRINKLQVEGQELMRRKCALEDVLRRTPRPGDRHGRRFRAVACLAIGVVLTIVAFFFSLLSFEPFRLGFTGKLVCIGIALITPYAVHELLGGYKSEKLLKGIIALAFVCAITGGALLAGIRANLVARQIQDTAPSVEIDGEVAAPVETQGSFYEETKAPMRLLMVLLALAIDLGAGVAIHRAMELGDDSGQDHRQVFEEMTTVNVRLGEIVSELTSRTNAPALFEAGFWRDFYRAMLTQSAKRAGSKLLGIFLCLVFFVGGKAFGQEKLNLVVAVDLTASESVKGHYGESQFHKNMTAVERLLGSTPAGSKVSVIGITEDSFGRPCILLSATISGDAGYFGERLASARHQLLRAWQKQALQVGANAKKTDILGAILLASELFRQTRADKNVLVLYSDMRNTTNRMNFERSSPVNVQAGLSDLSRRGFIGDLHGAIVYLEGVDATGLTIGQWNRIRQFWTGYLAATGATVVDYSILDGIPKLEP